MNNSFYVYVLYSNQNDKYYTGSSSDPQKRLLSHNDPRNKGWTKRYAPWKMIFVEGFNNKHDALLRERWLKTGVGREYINQKHHGSF